MGLYLRSVAEETGDLWVAPACLTANIDVKAGAVNKQKSGVVGAWGPKTGL